jgi:uncharacterized protein (TIGR02594 family)
MTLPKIFFYLNDLQLPKVVSTSLAYYGLKEVIGSKSNPIILKWSAELGLAKEYTTDSIPWCGLGMAKVVSDAGYTPVLKPLWALNWENFGTRINKNDAMLGDILTFKRTNGGHVGLYIAETKTTYFVLGSNQSDTHCITEIQKSRLHSVSRCKWLVAQPESVKKYFLNSSGKVSTNEI